MVLGHVDLELLGVGAGRRLPSAILVGRVEVVGQVLGLRVAHFPICGETGFLYERKEKAVLVCVYHKTDLGCESSDLAIDGGESQAILSLRAVIRKRM